MDDVPDERTTFETQELVAVERSIHLTQIGQFYIPNSLVAVLFQALQTIFGDK